MQKIVFLDFDGVVNTELMYYLAMTQEGDWTDEYGLKFDPDSVANLKTVVDATGAAIVAITSWKVRGLDYLQDLWHQRQMPGELTDITPSSYIDFRPGRHCEPVCVEVPCESKGEEITEWLQMEKAQGRETRYVIFDDCQDFTADQQPFFIRINSKVGITAQDAQRAIEILGRG